MKPNRLDFIVAIIAFFTVFALKINLPVWAIFFGWAWYFVLGGNVSVFKKAIPSMLLGFVLGGISIFASAASSGNFYVLAATVCVTVFILMLSLKTKLFSCSLASFNAYSIIFAGFYALNFPNIVNGGFGDIGNILIAIAWFSLASIVGLICGYVSITLSTLKKNKKGE